MKGAFPMANLAKFTLDYDERSDNWQLRNDQSNRLIKSFDTKADALEGGALKRAVGAEGGSVKIPQLSGAELIQSLRALNPTQLILRLSGSLRDHPVEGLPGDVPTVFKPFHPSELIQAVRKLLES
jgi:hypothetical protein